MLDNTFESFSHIVHQFLPIVPPQFCDLFHRDNLFVSRNRIPIVDSMPVLFLSSAEDWAVFPRHMENMYALCGSNNKALVRFPGEGHGSNKEKQDYWSHVGAFIVLIMNSKRNNTPLDPFLHIPHIALPGTP